MAMYQLLSPNAQAVTTQADFVARMDAIASEVGITEVKVTVEDGPDLDLNVPIKVTYSTGTVGKFSQDNTLQMVQEANEWRFDWSPSMIFTQLGDGCVDFMVENVRRGSILDRNGEPLAVPS